MRFYCVEWDWNFNSALLAYILSDCGLTIYRRQFEYAYA